MARGLVAELWRLLQAAERDLRNYPHPELSAIRFSFGSIPHACWEFKEGFHMEGTFDDIRQAVRSLVASPGPTLVAVLTITRRGVFHSVPDLVQTIDAFLAAWNADPKPFVWTATVASTQQKLARCRQTLGQIQPGCTQPPRRRKKLSS